MNTKYKSTYLLATLISFICHNTYADNGDSSAHNDNDSDEVMVVTAAEQSKQALGVSVITQKELSKMPPRNDISEIIRTMPGVSLTGNSTSGQRGNNRQIDIRGMGPENTLILVDGRPVKSRMSVRYGWGVKEILAVIPIGYLLKLSKGLMFCVVQPPLVMVMVLLVVS